MHLPCTGPDTATHCSTARHPQGSGPRVPASALASDSISRFHYILLAERPVSEATSSTFSCPPPPPPALHYRPVQWHL